MDLRRARLTEAPYQAEREPRFCVTWHAGTLSRFHPSCRSRAGFGRIMKDPRHYGKRRETSLAHASPLCRAGFGLQIRCVAIYLPDDTP